MVLKFETNRHAQVFIILALSQVSIVRLVLSENTVTYGILHHDTKLEKLAAKVNACTDLDKIIITNFMEGAIAAEAQL
jgi:hypothetical protein